MGLNQHLSHRFFLCLWSFVPASEFGCVVFETHRRTEQRPVATLNANTSLAKNGWYAKMLCSLGATVNEDFKFMDWKANRNESWCGFLKLPIHCIYSRFQSWSCFGCDWTCKYSTLKISKWRSKRPTSKDSMLKSAFTRFHSALDFQPPQSVVSKRHCNSNVPKNIKNQFAAALSATSWEGKCSTSNLCSFIIKFSCTFSRNNSSVAFNA